MPEKEFHGSYSSPDWSSLLISGDPRVFDFEQKNVSW